MTDRGQLTTPRLPVVLAVVLLVGAIVVNEVQTELAAVGGPVVTTCGLCHVDWRPAAGLLIIGALVAIARWLLAPWPQRAAEGDSDE